MNVSRKNEGANLDRRSFLKVSLLASGALMVGVGSFGTLRAGEAGKTWKPNLYAFGGTCANRCADVFRHSR